MNRKESPTKCSFYKQCMHQDKIQCMSQPCEKLDYNMNIEQRNGIELRTNYARNDKEGNNNDAANFKSIH